MRLGVIDGARTRDSRNHNPGLYQLSYDHPQGHCKKSPVSVLPAWKAFAGILCLQAEALAFSLLRYGMYSEGRPDSLEVSILYSHLGFDVSSERTTFRVSLMLPICHYRLSM